MLTGRPFSSFRGEWETPQGAITGIFLTRERDDLYERINRRVEEMFRNGVVEEVRSAADAGPTASQAIGFREIQPLLAGEIDERECIERVQQATRRYAKRQLTWFRRETIFTQLNLSLHSLETVVQLIERD